MIHSILNFPRLGRSGGQAAPSGAAGPSIFVFLAFLAVLVCRGDVRAQLPGPKEDVESKETEKKTLSDVRDMAKMFDDQAIEAARKELRRIEQESHVSTVIETVETLKGESIEKAAEVLARHSGIQGIFILIAKKEHTIEVLVSHKFQSAVTPALRDAIKDKFIADFRRRQFSVGLKQGVAMIGIVLADASKTDEWTTTKSAARAFGLGISNSPPAPVTPALVVRDRVRLTLSGARTILAGAEAKAASMNLKINIAVVDDGGHLLAFERVDGARPASAYTAITKAVSAATYHQATGPQPPSASSPNVLLSLSLQNAAQASGGKITTLLGGLPIVVDDQVIGGVGIGGGTGEQDAQIAKAGLQSFLEQLPAIAKDATEKSK